MIKLKKFSVYNDFRTGILYKIFILFAIFLLSIFIFVKTISTFTSDKGFFKNFYDLSLTNIPNIILSFSILFFAFGLIIYFFHHQFTKLANIAEELEKEDVDIEK